MKTRIGCCYFFVLGFFFFIVLVFPLPSSCIFWAHISNPRVENLDKVPHNECWMDLGKCFSPLVYTNINTYINGRFKCMLHFGMTSFFDFA